MSLSKTLLTLEEVNELSYKDFIQTFGNVVEKCPLFAAVVCNYRPFSEFADITDAFSKFMDDLPQTGKESVLRLYPDLAGRLAMSGQLSKESTREQTTAGLFMLTGGERQRMTMLNTLYKDRFGFPFVICGRMNVKDTIFKSFRERLQHSVDDEIAIGTSEVIKIACLRLKDIVNEPSI